jgi:hypothetical protein
MSYISKKIAQEVHAKTSKKFNNFYATFSADTIAIKMNIVHEKLNEIKSAMITDSSHTDYESLAEEASQLVEAALSIAKHLKELQTHEEKLLNKIEA